MRGVAGEPATGERDDPVGGGTQPRAVRGQHDGGGAGQLADHGHHDRLGGRVEVLAGLVEQHQRHAAGGDAGAGPQHRAGQRDAAPLPGGDLRAALAEFGARVRCVAQRHCGGDLLLVGARVAERDLGADRGLGGPGALRQPGDVGLPGGDGQPGQLDEPAGHGADVDRAGGGCGRAEQAGQQRRLARSAAAVQRDDLAGQDLQVHPVERGHVASGVAHGEPGQSYPAVAAHRGGGRPGRRQRGGGGDHVERGTGGGAPLLAGVVLRAHRPQRGEQLRRQQQHDQRGGQAEPAVVEPQPDVDGDHRNRQGGHQVEDQAGQERGAQRGHGVPAVGLAGPPHGLDLPVRAAVDPQRGQPGDQVEEVAGQPGQDLVLAAHPAPGGDPDERHEQRHER